MPKISFLTRDLVTMSQIWKQYSLICQRHAEYVRNSTMISLITEKSLTYLLCKKFAVGCSSAEISRLQNLSCVSRLATGLKKGHFSKKRGTWFLVIIIFFFVEFTIWQSTIPMDWIPPAAWPPRIFLLGGGGGC